MMENDIHPLVAYSAKRNCMYCTDDNIFGIIIHGDILNRKKT